MARNVAVFGLVTEETPGILLTLTDAFETGMGNESGKPFLGYRPKISDEPLKFADHYIWYSYADVDVKRRHIGSALHTLFSQGKLGGGDLETVGIWSPNRPGMLSPYWMPRLV